MGSNRDRYHSCEEIQKYAGIAPVTERSGKKAWIHWRYSCTKFLRQRLLNGRDYRCVIHFGQELITGNKKAKENHIILLSGH